MKFVTKLGLSAASAALIIGPLLGTAVFFEARSVLQERIVNEQVQSAKSVMREIDTAMHRAYLDVSVIAADELLRGFLESSADRPEESMVAEELEERERLTGPWDALTVFDASGRAVFATKPLGDEAAISAYPSSEPGFQRALKGEIFYSDRVVRRSTGMPVVIFAAPVYGRADPDKVVGVVVAHYRWASVQGILDQVDPVAGVHLMNREGIIIGKRSNDPFDVEGVPSMERVTTKGETVGSAIASHPSHGEGSTLKVEVEQGGVQDYHGSGWRLLLEQPLDRIFSPIMKMARDTALLVFGALLVLAGLYSFIGRRFLSPLDSLVKGVRQVAGGKLDGKVVVRSEDEFGDLADDFNAMVDRLQERTRQLQEAQIELVKKEQLAMLGQVAGSVGHELRNPLGVMSNAVYYLQTVLSDTDDATQEYLGIIKDEIARSERIVAELLDAVHTRPPQVEAVGVGELIEQALRNCSVPSSVAVKLDIPATLPPLRVDAMQIHQAFCNLISNGVEAMPEGGTLEIRAVENKQDGTVTVSVRDSGTGIAPAVLAKLFQPLFTTKARGIGLGLVVVKNLTQANGGSVKVESEVGKGSVFSVILPAAQ
ncbi:MAG: HAMP domain-containing protein [Sulfuricella sp.]|nr:HAMP domain-containing protein [Sulfuricella sp.]